MDIAYAFLCRLKTLYDINKRATKRSFPSGGAMRSECECTLRTGRRIGEPLLRFLCYNSSSELAAREAQRDFIAEGDLG